MTCHLTPDELWMEEALKEANIASSINEVPVGCVIVIDEKIVARGHNQREQLADPTAHAEVLALRDAARQLGHWRLTDATVYVTLEPCPMCAGALVNARISRLVFGAFDPKAGACETLFQVGQDSRLNHCFSVTSGIRADESAELLRAFFRARRKKKNTAAVKASEL